MAIKAGDVVWNITGKTDGLRKGLTDSKQQIGSFAANLGATTKKVGMAFTAMGTAIVGTITGMAFKFAAYGDEVAKAAKRTGLSTEAISRLKHAAEQSGTSLTSVEAGLKRMSRVLSDATYGLETARRPLEYLGFTVESFRGKSPEETFIMLADAISRVPDPLKQAALAQEIFGRGGVDLLPLMNEGAAGIRAYGEEAQRLGLVLDQEAASKAEQFTDTIDELKKSFRGAVIAVGPLIADALIPLANQLKDLIIKAKDWLKENPGFVGGFVKAALAIGGLMVVLGPILGLLGSIIPAVAAIAGGISAPVLAVVAIVIGAVAAIIYWWDELKEGVIAVWDIIRVTFEAGGNVIRMVMDAIVGIFKAAWNAVKGVVDWIVGAVDKAWNAVTSLPGAIGEMLGFAAGGVVPGYATGGVIQGLASGGLARHRIVRVGEKGPELAALPIGTRVMSNAQMNAAVSGRGGGRTVHIGNINVNARFEGTDLDNPGHLDRVSKALAERIGTDLAAAGVLA